MKYFAVIDTNVIVSAMLKNDSMPAQVLKEVLVGNINMLVNEQILDEYLEVLSRKKFRFPIDKSGFFVYNRDSKIHIE